MVGYGEFNPRDQKIQPRTKSEVLCALVGEGLERYGSNERTLEVVGLDRCGYQKNGSKPPSF
jgi:hypothetical protein